MNPSTSEVFNLRSQHGNLVSDIRVGLVWLPALTFIFSCRERPYFSHYVSRPGVFDNRHLYKRPRKYVMRSPRFEMGMESYSKTCL